MKKTYRLETTEEFEKQYKHYTKRNSLLNKRILIVLGNLMEDPFYKGLHKHKVNTRNFGNCYSSRINGDLRII